MLVGRITHPLARPNSKIACQTYSARKLTNSDRKKPSISSVLKHGGDYFTYYQTYKTDRLKNIRGDSLTRDKNNSSSNIEDKDIYSAKSDARPPSKMTSGRKKTRSNSKSSNKILIEKRYSKNSPCSRIYNNEGGMRDLLLKK